MGPPELSSRAEEAPIATDAPHFADALIARTRKLGHPLCVGFDPHLDRIPPLFRRGTMRPADPATAEAVEAFLGAVLDRVADRVAVVKPQAAFFEQLGWPGVRVLARVMERARERGLLVLLDAKRGDIGSTAEGYARAYLAADAPMPADAMTLNPYLGRDTLRPFANAAADNGRGIFVLTKTSNPGSGDFQDREIDGVPLYERVARALAPLCEELAGPETGWSSLGVVVGATFPDQAPRVREALPRALLLVPGYGAQGAAASESVRGFVRCAAGLEGGIVSSSRGVLFPEAADTDDAAVWEKALDGALERAIADLAEAVSGADRD